MIQVRFKGYDLRLDPATPERIQAKDSEFGCRCQAAVFYAHAICNFLRMHYFPMHDFQARHAGAVDPVGWAALGSPEARGLLRTLAENGGTPK
jgi:hypothetical protein